MRWIAWYIGGRRYVGQTETDWSALPATGLLNVTVLSEPIPGDADGDWYRRHYNGADWVWLYRGEWGELLSAGAISSGAWKPPPDIPPELLKRGDPVPDEEWAAVWNEVLEVTCPPA